MTAEIVWLEALRHRRGIPLPRPEAFLPPLGKRQGDKVELASGEQGIVVGWAPRAVFGRGSTVVLAVQVAGRICVMPAADVAPAPAKPAAQLPCDVEA